MLNHIPFFQTWKKVFSTNYYHFLPTTMAKIEGLNHVHAAIEQQCIRFQQQEPQLVSLTADLDERPRQLERLRYLQAEALAHRQMLELADLACGLGLAGEEPKNWAEWGEGQPYDSYEELLIAFDSLPGEGQLSPGLLAYIEELPGRLQQEHDQLISSMRADTFIWVDNPMKSWSEQQVWKNSVQVLTKQVEATGFAVDYATDLVEARQLTEARGDLARIQELVA